MRRIYRRRRCCVIQISPPGIRTSSLIKRAARVFSIEPQVGALLLEQSGEVGDTAEAHSGHRREQGLVVGPASPHCPAAAEEFQPSLLSSPARLLL